MTLEEAIKHSRDKYEELKDSCRDCAEDHKQLAQWLEELKVYKEKEKIKNLEYSGDIFFL